METRRKNLIGDRTPKDFGIKKTFRKRPYFYTYCDRKKCPRKKRAFGGWTVDLVMGNVAIHQQWHEGQDRKAATAATVN